MASIHKRKHRSFFYCAFSMFDANTNRFKRVFRSTGILANNNRKDEAKEICRTWYNAAKLARKEKLSPDKAREMIEQCVSDVAAGGRLSADAAREIVALVVNDILKTAKLELIEQQTIRSWCERWLEAKAIEAEASTHVRYKRVIDRFFDCIGAKAKRDLSALQATDIMRFRDREAKALSRATANLSLKILRVCFGDAVKQGLLAVNPAVRVPVLKSTKESKRRAFTLREIKRILRACGNDIEWRGLILFGLYLGQRLGDLARLTWRAVDLESGEIAFTTRKTAKRAVLPLLQPLSDYLSALPASDDANAFIFPNAASATRTGTLSNRFRDILVEAGLVEPRTHESTGKGRSRSREASELSFHSLRHSTTSMLKAAGVSDFMAMQIVGHESSAISRAYSHLSTDDLRRAMAKLPDVTNA